MAESELHYTTDDDGIWLFCITCRDDPGGGTWDWCLGIGPSVAAVVEAWNEHVTTHHRT